MDWRDSNIVLGEQMNTRGYDASRLLPTHKGVGILRPDGDSEVGADVLAVTVRTDYMPNEDWRIICERARVLREAEGTLTGHAAGHDVPPAQIGPAAVVEMVGDPVAASPEPVELPEPLASVVDYVDDHADDREFIPTAELAHAAGLDANVLGRQLTDLGCPAVRGRVAGPDGVRQVRGFSVAAIRRVADHHAHLGDPL